MTTSSSNLTAEAHKDAVRIVDRRLLTDAFWLTKRAKKDTGKADSTSVVNWLIEQKNAAKFSKVTYRQYKRALLAVLPDGPAKDRLSNEPQTGARASSGRERWAKSISKRGLKTFLRAVSTMSPKSRNRAIAWIVAGHTTGLRPSEWKNAMVTRNDEGQPVLIVQNGKASHGRAHGKERRLVLITEESLAAVRLHLNNIREAEMRGLSFERFHASTTETIQRAYQRIGVGAQGRIALYSARHQFKTEAVHSGLAADEIAYLMGHASIETAQRHYGRRGTPKGGGPRISVERAVADMPTSIQDSIKKILGKTKTKGKAGANSVS